MTLSFKFYILSIVFSIISIISSIKYGYVSGLIFAGISMLIWLCGRGIVYAAKNYIE